MSDDQRYHDDLESKEDGVELVSPSEFSFDDEDRIPSRPRRFRKTWSSLPAHIISACMGASTATKAFVIILIISIIGASVFFMRNSSTQRPLSSLDPGYNSEPAKMLPDVSGSKQNGTHSDGFFRPTVPVGSPAYQGGKAVRKALVLSTVKSTDTSWEKHIPDDWAIVRYVMDDPTPTGNLTVPRNQGREGMGYLTYIIDNYHDLPEVVVFAHGHEEAWHQPEKLHVKVRALNITAVQEETFLNLRCNINFVCGDGQGYRYKLGPTKVEEATPELWKLLFPSGKDELSGVTDWPETVKFRCCGQFAVSKEAIKKRTLEQWIQIRKPMTRDMHEYEGFHEIEKDPSYAFGIMYEPMWHIFFGKDALE